ncbi:MAG TPA: hypothetical protein VH325_16685 [Bryobacteraceae bacterium]|jgi:hypothetical protein|nr:hypothetical protein [Bryobacteraceae bacterium]
MSWIYSFLIAVITAILVATATGFLGAACVDWYHVSSREGGSAYFVVVLILLGAFCGFVGGLILSRFAGSSFLIGLGISAGSLLAVEGVIALVAWGLADIPPKINGHELDLVVEIRLPSGATQPPVIAEKQFIEFSSGEKGAIPRVRETGTLEVAKAKLVDGRWTLPGSVRIVTTRDYRFLTIVLGEKNALGFQLMFPGNPGRRYEQWSDWQPTKIDSKHPWPDTRMSYRFRIQERIPVVAPEPPDPFNALTPASPLAEWLVFSDGFARVPARQELIDQQAKARPKELAALIRSAKWEEYGPAMDLVDRLKFADPQILDALHEVANAIQDQLKAFNEMSPQDPGYTEAADQIMTRYNRWANPWFVLHETNPSEGRPPIDAMLRLASLKHKEEPHMMALIQNAQYAQSQFAH